MNGSSFDFDVISGPATPRTPWRKPGQREPETAPAPQPPQRDAQEAPQQSA